MTAWGRDHLAAGQTGFTRFQEVHQVLAGIWHDDRKSLGLPSPVVGLRAKSSVCLVPSTYRKGFEPPCVGPGNPG